MSKALQVFYEQMNFDSISKLLTGKRTVLPFPDDIESWSTSLSSKILTNSNNAYKQNERYYVLLEFVKRGATSGYVVLAIPVTVDVPDKDQGQSIYLQPNIAESIALNAEYYLGEHNHDTPAILLNDAALPQEALSHSRRASSLCPSLAQ